MSYIVKSGVTAVGRLCRAGRTQCSTPVALLSRPEARCCAARGEAQ